ncbi:hypothetical protein LY76DRAFT_599481 [Colletotrichum caudatum]|nr:hypothetical protein LY76DRAFT_599481 [Colletotrichum caudatum]
MSRVAHRWLGLPTADPHVTDSMRPGCHPSIHPSIRLQPLSSMHPRENNTHYRLNEHPWKSGQAQHKHVTRVESWQTQQHHARSFVRSVAIRPRPE